VIFGKKAKMGKKKQFQKIATKQAKAVEQPSVQMSLKDISLLGLQTISNSSNAYVSLKYFRPEHQCFSVWQSEELRAFSSFCRKLTVTSWAEIYKSGGSPGDKTGFGYTVHKNVSVLPENLESISPDLTWFELRVTGEARAHGFRATNAFFLVFLDRQHEIYPG
jgi:hypothetical protein